MGNLQAVRLVAVACPIVATRVLDDSSQSRTEAEKAPWQSVKEDLIKGHPLYGRTILRSELQALKQMIADAWALPIGRHWSVAYLIQGEEDVTEKEAAMWGPSSDVFVLTFRNKRRDSIFFPDSLLAEGRNVLLSAAAASELQRGSRYTYYVFLDADTAATPAWSVWVPAFEAFLQEWLPAVGVPRYDDAPLSGSLPTSLWHFDHIVVAVHAEAALNLLPYNTTFDRDCAWVSQWVLTLQASALYRPWRRAGWQESRVAISSRSCT